MDVLKQLKLGRGRGRVGKGFRGSVSRGRGAGRSGRGGRGRGTNNTIRRAVEVIDLDDGDDICNMALAKVELENNPLVQSFEELNSATELNGYDPTSAGGIWIYPINRPVRDYQFDIVNTALFHNTLVSLPTGLGKTFISAVVMYNFCRWYPTGIIIFMAPTRPLVAQQLSACHNTVGIEKSKTVELTGHIPAKKREQLWKTKTVFFLTPQVMLSDIKRNFFQLENVRCVVVDEAHKALGNYAYVEVISKLVEKNRQFRVLALSATPGSDLAAVQQVFRNLLISRVELRSDSSPDILPYIHDKKKDVRIVTLTGYVKEVYDRIVEIFQEYSGKLMKIKALAGKNAASYSKFQILKARETFRASRGKHLPNYQKSYIEIDFNLCISLAHSIEILNSHGLRTFYIFLLGVLDKKKGQPAVTFELRKNEQLQLLIKDLQGKLNISIENSTFDFDMDNTSTLFTTIGDPATSRNVSHSINKNVDVDYTLSHPKLTILKEIIHKHFLDYIARNDTTRAIIFSQYRDSVQEIRNMLNALRPIVKPVIFIGKANTGTLGTGLKQKEQIKIVEQFRNGDFNVLVATSVGEEGLDIGEVDLIVCFDASRSPTRLIQRMGRTGRQRDGKTIFLLTSGKEERSYAMSINQHSKISKTIADPKQLEPFLYKSSPRMVPLGIELICYKIEINLPSEQPTHNQSRVLGIEKNESEETEEAEKEKPSAKKMKSDEQLPQKIAYLTKEHVPDPPSPPIIDDGYVVEDDSHMFAVERHDVKNSSVINKIFDLDSTEGHEWAPCISFYKQNMPPTKAVSELLTNSELNNLVLDLEDLTKLERSVQNRSSFSFVNKDFCECGNTMESKEASPAPDLVTRAKTVVTAANRDNRNDVEDHVVDIDKEQAAFDDSFDLDEKDSEVEGEMVAGREKFTDISCSVGNAPSEEPLSPRRIGMVASAESSSEELAESKSKFKFKKHPSNPLIDIESPMAVDVDSSESHDDSGGEVDKIGFKVTERKHRSNPFIESQVVVSDQDGGSTSDSTHDDENGDDKDDSFVDHEDDDNGVTETQQAMYSRSTRDAIPVRFGRIEKPLSPKNDRTATDTSEEECSDDSFYQNDDEVEYSNVGVYTQAMNQAKIDIAGGSSSRHRYQTRRAKKVEDASKGKTTSQPKKRRRIIAMYSSSSDEN